MVSVIATICESLSFVHASDFLPMLIYVTLLANPKNLHANVLYSILPFNHIELTPLNTGTFNGLEHPQGSVESLPTS